jgi:hypothetical protein
MARKQSVRPAAPARAVPSIPRWLPPAIFVALTLVLFRSFVFGNGMLFGNDTLALGYAARAFYANALKQLHTFPRWAPQILGGTPFLEALSGGDSLYPPSFLLLLLLEPYRALGWKLVLHVCAAGFFMFGWVRSLGGSRPAALLGGTAYMLAPYLVSLVHPGHDGKIFVTSLTPLLFWAVEHWFTRPRLPAFTAVALVVGLVIFTTHFQMAYFLFGAVGVYALFRTVQTWRGATDADGAAPQRRGRTAGLRFALFLAASIAGVGVAAVQFLPAVQYVTQDSRRVQTTREAAQETGVAWASSWSLHPEEAMAMLIPEFAGNDAGGAAWAQNTYWGRNPTKDNHEGAGVVVLLLAAVALLGGGRRGRQWFFAALATVALLFGLGAHTPVWRLFYAVVPGVRLFRAPSQVMFLFAFSASTLGALGLDRLIGAKDVDATSRPALKRTLWIGAGVLGVLALLASSGALTSFWTSVVYSGATQDRLTRLAALQPFIVRGAWITFLLALAAAGLVWAMDEEYLAPAAVVAGLVVLVAVDEFRVDAGFIQVIDFQQWAAPDPNIQAILRNEAGSTEPYRLLSFQQQGQDVKPSLEGIELAAGHHPNDLNRYRELIGMVGSGLPENLLDRDIRRLLNVKYILWPDYEFGQSISGPTLSRTTLRDGRPYATVLQEDGLPRARLVGDATVKSDSEDVAYMLSDAFDPEREAVLSEPPPIELDGTPASGTVRWLERTPDELRLDVTTDRSALLVVADNWYPAWHATVDGAEAPVLRAYHTLRAVPVPAGEHTVDMVYRSAWVARGLWISLILFFGLTGATGFQLWRERRAGSPS